jgi:thiol-disulfide isomerase/thioredoxin
MLLFVLPASKPAAQRVEFKDLGRAPEIKLPLVGEKGSVKLSEMVKDGPVLVDFWATWCGPCRKAMPEYIELYQRYSGRGFRILAVSQDLPQMADKVEAYRQAQGIPFNIVIDKDKRVAREYGVSSLPTAVLIDRRRHAVAVHLGYRPGNRERLAAQIEALLGDSPRPPGGESTTTDESMR